MAFDLFKEVTVELTSNDPKYKVNAPEPPEDVQTFLGQLGLLREIPLHYLIPDERYLEIKEGNAGGVLKLFCLDSEWVECLMDGALSITNNDIDRKFLLDKAMDGNYVAKVLYKEAKEQIKRQIKGLYSPEEFGDKMQKHLRQKRVLNDENKVEPTPAQSNWRYTGFLMRSSLLSGWKGIEITAKGKYPVDSSKTGPLQVVRMEKLAADTLFCVCEGVITEVEIVQPPEGFHFGRQDPKDFPKKEGKPEGVIDIKKLSGTITESALLVKDGNIISKPLKVILSVNWTEKTDYYDGK